VAFFYPSAFIMSGIIGYIIPFPDSKYYVQSLAGQGQKKVKSKK